MTEATHNFTRSRGAGILVTFGTLLYFCTLALALYELDRQHFVGAKQSMIRNNFYDIFEPPLDLGTQARAVLLADEAQRRSKRQLLEQRLQSIIAGPTSIYSYILKDDAGRVLLEVADTDKARRMNSWKNCLLIRRFDGLQDNTIPLSEPPDPKFGHLVAHYASPPDYQPLEALTKKYRVYAGALAFVWVIVYYFIYKYLLGPMQKVTAHLAASRMESPRLISRPGGLLENSYNEMAGQALLQQLEERLNALTRPGAMGRNAAMEDALEFVANSFSLERLVVCELSSSGEKFALIECFAVPPEVPASSTEVTARAAAFDADVRTNGASGNFQKGPAGAFEFLERLGATTLYIFGALRTDVPDLRFRSDSLRRVCETMRRALLTYRAHQQDIFRQRSEANIVLSRNLGHDLTNIIATSKLELLAVKQLLDKPQVDGARGQLLRESVQGLLDNTKFLQEIVNIYRSFSHVKKPQYERHVLNTIVEEFLACFEPSFTTRVRIVRDFQEKMPPPIVEPRLLKLALFNLLTNALDAIRKASAPSEQRAQITIRTRFDETQKVYTVTVEDNGPGIRDPQGRLLDSGEIDSVFQYGYSTKSEGSEGLGLSWVRTIIEDFHDGRIHAENRRDGGARFEFTLHSMEAAEAKVQAG